LTVEPTHLPDGDLIATGLDDLRRGLETVPSLVVSIGAPRLRRLGHAVPPGLPGLPGLPEPEHRLYAATWGQSSIDRQRDWR
jgi:hypothetical protein